MEILILIKFKFDIIFLEILLALIYFNPLSNLFSSAFQIVFFLLFGIALAKNTKIWSEGIKISSLGIIIFFYSLFRCFIADHFNLNYFSTFQVVIARYQFMIAPIIYLYITKLNNREKRNIFYFALNCILGTIIISLYYIFFVDPQAIRNTQRAEQLFGVGDFSLMYSIAILIGPLIFLIKERMREGRGNKYFIFVAILMVLCLLLCNLVTAVVVGFVSVMITFVITRKLSCVFSLTVISAGIVFILKEAIGNFFHNIAAQELFYWSTNKKIIAIGNVFLGDFENIDTLSVRMRLANYSLNSFAENPILGVNWKDHQSGVIGCHMQWADDLGRYGILGNLIIWFNYLYIARYTINNTANSFVKDCMRSAWAVLFILGFLNPCLSNAVLMVLFVIIPTFDSMLDGKEIYDLQIYNENEGTRLS